MDTDTIWCFGNYIDTESDETNIFERRCSMYMIVSLFVYFMNEELFL